MSSSTMPPTAGLFERTMIRPLAVACLILLTAHTGLSAEGVDHWAFRPATRVQPPSVRQPDRVQTPIDNFVLSRLDEQQMSINEPADRFRLIRRLSLGLTGLPPTPEETASFVADHLPDATTRLVERLLASPAYGERWGKIWLDAAGYADSNGYFAADSDRPVAHKYRDYVIRAFNSDKPYDQFVREQLAGDELASYSPDSPVVPETIELLTATHFLRNSQDGTSESDGNDDEVTVDRATVLEGTLQITMNTLLGITIQCARCHEHKFEPIEHEEYYQLQSVFYPAFPFAHREKWVGPQSRVSHVASSERIAAWESKDQRLDSETAELRREFVVWATENSPPGIIRFQDDFDDSQARLAAKWSSTAPGDDQPAGKPAVNLDSDVAPGAQVREGKLEILESGGQGNRWLSTRAALDWTPSKKGEWVQVTFDLVSDRVMPDTAVADRIGYYVALRDFDDSGPAGGNILIDGNPKGGAEVELDYPGDDAKSEGKIGKSGYQPGHNYGICITHIDDNKFRVEQLVDWVPEEGAITLTAEELPDGGFGFEYCCDRSFIVDNVTVQSFTTGEDPQDGSGTGVALSEAYRERRQALADALEKKAAQRTEKPGKLAWVTDLINPVPDVHLLKRGLYATPGKKVEPAGLGILTDLGTEFQLPVLPPRVASSGRRLALANWLTRPGSRPAALMTRVMVNRIWQQHFGTGLVTTPDNLGQSGAPPSHPQLLEYLAARFIDSGWSIKEVHRLIVQSAVYQQSSVHRQEGFQVDPENKLLWRYPLRRLDAEAIRDSMLSVAGELDGQMFGRYVPTVREEDGNVVVEESCQGARRRGIYLQQRRTQINSMLALFDAPSMMNTCGQRSKSTVPLQSLVMLNSSFVQNRSASLARRVISEVPEAGISRTEWAFQLVFGRDPEPVEREAAVGFLEKQRGIYNNDNEAEQKAMTDLCQMLFASNAFLYVE